MKRITLAILLLSLAALAGCQTIKAHNPFRTRAPDYQAAQQEQPLEVPPGLDQPPSAEALTIPGSEAAGAQSPVGVPAMGDSSYAAPGGAVGNSLTLSDTPASAYHRIGLALARTEVGQVTAHDDSALSYQVAVDTVVSQKREGGFFHRMFHSAKNKTVKGTVTLTVAPSGTGSVVSAQGNADAVSRVMLALRQRLR